MDLNQDVWDRLRANGHTIGTTYYQVGAGLLIDVDGVAMSTTDARAVAQKRATVAQIAQVRNSSFVDTIGSVQTRNRASCERHDLPGVFRTT